MALVAVNTSSAQLTQRVSVAWNGAQGNGQVFQFFSPSSDGRFVAFVSFATNLVTGDTNNHSDVFVRDRWTGTTERVNVSDGGAQANTSTNALPLRRRALCRVLELRLQPRPGDTNGIVDVFVRDRLLGTIERVSVGCRRIQATRTATSAAISADGRYVAFYSNAKNLVAGDTNANDDVFVRDRLAGTTECVSVESGGALGNVRTAWGPISADGRYVVVRELGFEPRRRRHERFEDVFVHDRVTGPPSA